MNVCSTVSIIGPANHTAIASPHVAPTHEIAKASRATPAPIWRCETPAACSNANSRRRSEIEPANNACRLLGRTQTAALAPRAMFAGFCAQSMLEVDPEGWSA